MGTRRNWAGTETVTPRRVVAPRGVDEVVTAVRDAVRDGLRVKAVGAGHSFTGAVSTGTHGSGERFGSLSTQLRWLELVTAAGCGRLAS